MRFCFFVTALMIFSAAENAEAKQASIECDGGNRQFLTDFERSAGLIEELRDPAERGNNLAQLLLASALIMPALQDENSSDVSIADAAVEGLGWLERAAEGDCADAQFFLSSLYMSGAVAPFDPTLGRWWYQQAYVTGHPEANSRIRTLEQGLMYRRVPFGGEPNPPSEPTQEMIEWYREQGLAGNPWAAFAMARYAMSPSGRWHWLNAAADLNLAEANTAIGDIYSDEHWTAQYSLVGVDMDRAREYWLRGARLGDGNAANYLFGLHFRRDTNGGYNQSPEAQELFDIFRGCVDGPISGYHCAGLVAASYHYGFGVEIDQQEAERWQGIADRMLEDAGFASGRPMTEPQPADSVTSPE